MPRAPLRKRVPDAAPSKHDGEVAIPFLRAEWRRLAMVTWRVPDDALAPLLPPGMEPDRWEGSALASLVAFEFSKTAIFGMSAIGFRFFPEWNLRFYVREPASGRRGVVFVRELVPSAVVAVAARLSYGEPYRAVRYEYAALAEGGGFSARHRVHADGRAHEVTLQAAGEPAPPPTGAIERFLTEIPWGFRARAGRRQAYRVLHPQWRFWARSEVILEVGLADLYGPQWAFLDGFEPVNRLVAEGSAVEVHLPAFERA